MDQPGAFGFCMNDFSQIIVTVTTGVTIFTAGQIAQRLFIEPIQEQRKLQARIIQTLAFYSRLEVSNKSLKREVEETVRNLTAELQAIISTIPLYDHLAKLHIVPERHVMREVTMRLMVLSLRMTQEAALANERKILQLLKIDEVIPVNIGLYTKSIRQKDNNEINLPKKESQE